MVRPHGIRSLLSIVVMTFSMAGYAQLESTLKWNGQNQEVLKLQGVLKTIRAVPVEVDATCTRQVPKPVKVCEDVTRTRQECRQVPAARVCEDEERESCSNVPTTSYECDTGSRTVCSSAPSREVCVDRPVREVCRTLPSGREHCTEVGGGTHCTTVGGGQECHEESYETNCRNVTSYERECTSTTEEVCRNVPAHRECDDVPYTVNECRTVMQAVTEQYACRQTQIQDQTHEKKVTIDLNVQILTNGLVGEIPLKIAALPTDARVNGLKLNVALEKEPSQLVILNKKTLKLVSETKDAIVMTGEVGLEIAELPIPVLPEAILKATLHKKTLALVVGLRGAVAQTGSVEVLVTDAKIPFRAELKTQYPSAKATLTEVKKVPTLTLDLREAVTTKLGKKLQLTLKISSPLSIQGEILNAVKPVTEKVIENVKVKVK